MIIIFFRLLFKDVFDMFANFGIFNSLLCSIVHVLWCPCELDFSFVYAFTGILNAEEMKQIYFFIRSYKCFGRDTSSMTRRIAVLLVLNRHSKTAFQ